MNIFCIRGLGRWMKLVALLVIIGSTTKLVSAITVEGYIISNSSDTVYGSVKLSKFDLHRKTVSISSYNFDDLFNQVFFKSATGKKFKWYSTDDIQEFSFVLENQTYRFISREVNTILSKRNKRNFFLQLENGPIYLFESRINRYDVDSRSQPYGMMLSEYYIMSGDNNLVIVNRTSKNQTIFEFLSSNIKLDSSLLTNSVKDMGFEDIVQIVRTYNLNFGDR